MSNIRARINARKVALIYFYERLVFQFVRDNFNSILKKFEISSNNVKIKQENFLKYLTDAELNLLKDLIKEDWNIEGANIWLIEFKVDEEINYIISNFFYKDDVDTDYALNIARYYDQYEQSVRQKVDELAKTFKFDEMDFIDRSIFLLWYIEYKEMKVDKPLVLNEMVELAKRYGDEWSYKLINWIGDRLLDN